MGVGIGRLLAPHDSRGMAFGVGERYHAGPDEKDETGNPMEMATSACRDAKLIL
jgi:hypothetical protein